MRKHVIVVVAMSLALAGCGSSAGSAGTSPSSQAATASAPSAGLTSELTPDEVLDTFIAAVSYLSSVENSKSSLIAGFQGFSDTVNPLVAGLTEGIPGVPENVTYDVAVALGVASTSLQMAAECLQGASDPDECSALTDAATTQMGDLGAAIAELVPFSNRSLDEFQAQVSAA